VFKQRRDTYRRVVELLASICVHVEVWADVRVVAAIDRTLEQRRLDSQVRLADTRLVAHAASLEIDLWNTVGRTLYNSSSVSRYPASRC
jgi:hypothetical protein